MPELEDIFGSQPQDEAPTEPTTPPAPETSTAAPVVQDTQPKAGYVDPPKAEPTVQTPPAPQGFANSSLYARARAAGLQLDGIESEADFAQAILDRYVAERPYADYGRTSLASPAQPKGAPEEDDEDQEAGDDGEDAFDLDGHFSSLWSAPQLDQSAQFAIQNGIVQLGDNGLYQAAPGFESMALPLLNTLNQAHIAQKTQLQKFFEGNPYRSVYDNLLPALRHQLSKDFQRLSQESVKTYEQEAFQEKWISDNKAWLYDQTGHLSVDGVKFSQTYAAMKANWRGDERQLVDYALKVSGANTKPEQPPAPTQNPPAQADGKLRDEQGKFKKATEGQPVEPPKSKQESFIDEARRKASASSSQNGYSDTGSNFVAANDGELDDLWSSDYRKYKAGAAA